MSAATADKPRGPSRALVNYIFAINVFAAVVLLSMPWTGFERHVVEIMVLAVLAVAVAARPVRIPALYTEVTSPDAFVFCAIAAIGPGAGATVAVAGVLGAALGRPRLPTPARLLFNLGSVSSASALAWLAFAAAGGDPGMPLAALLVPMGAATTTFFLLNTVFVAAAIALERHESIWHTWRRSGSWTAVTSFTGMTLAFALLFLLERFGVVGLVLGVPPCWMLAAFYQSHKDRLEEQQMRLDAVEEVNSQLEVKVAERTHALEEAMAHVEESNSSLREINERLEELSRVKSEFLAKVSHELRTPLNAVLGFAELLADPTFGPLQEQQSEFVRDIRSSGEGLLSLINDILDLSKIEAGRMEAHRQPVDLGVVIREITSMMSPLVRERQLTLSVRIEPDLAGARVDPGMFREMLTNLLSNAIKFTDAGGRVDVEARRIGKDLEVSVRDTGIGIADKDRESVFQEFYQVDGSYARRYEGTGLGLALVKRLAELHGGTIRVSSKLGAGSRFICLLPDCVCDAPCRVGDESGRWKTVPDTGHWTVLVVEDNALNRKLVRNALRARGHTIVEAETGEAALELVKRVPPDIVLMDIELKGLDGLEVTRRLKADPETAGLPIVALSAHAHCEHEQRALAAGCIGYIRKPVRLGLLPAEIDRHCRAARVVPIAS